MSSAFAGGAVNGMPSPHLDIEELIALVRAAMMTLSL